MALSGIAAQDLGSEALYSDGGVAENAFYSHNTAQACVVSQQEFDRLQKQADRLEHLLQVMPAGVVVIDGKGIVRQANAQAKSLLGEPLDGEIWRTIIQRSFRPRADDGHEVSLYDGRKVKLSISPLHNEPGQLIVITDLTETRQLQQRISHMQRLSALGKTVASLVHQIRTPLSAAILYASNLAGGKLSEPARLKFADKLQSRLGELEGQVNDMLLFAKSGEQQVVQPVSLTSIFDQVATSSESMLITHNAKLTIAQESPQLAVMGNLPALVGAIQNLIHNALQVKPSGACIQLHCAEDLQDPNFLCIDVVDNGPGIAQDQLDKIFEPFFTTRSQGTGLGLAVVASVAKSHHGEALASNNGEQGACFTLRLPKLDSLVDLPVANNQADHTVGENS